MIDYCTNFATNNRKNKERNEYKASPFSRREKDNGRRRRWDKNYRENRKGKKNILDESLKEGKTRMRMRV